MLTPRRAADCGRIASALRRVAAMIVAMAAFSAPAFADSLTGRAMIDVRMALPPGLTFEAVIVDMSRADAAAPVIGRTVIESPGQPPIGFTIDYDPADLQPQGVYALRATIRREGALMFTTDTVTPVLTNGGQGPVALRLRPVSGASGQDTRPLFAHGLRLPASFTGVLPCADCDGIRHHLDLWPDQVYHMRRDWLGRAEGPMRREEVGRWYADPARDAIVLYGASEAPQFWKVEGPDALRQMDMLGAPIVSDLPYELASDGTLTPTDLESLFLAAETIIGPDGPALRECLTWRVYPVDTDGAYAELAQAVAAHASSADAPLLVSLDARIVYPRPGLAPQVPRLSVLRFVNAFPGESCPMPEPTATLTNTYWRIDSLEGEALARVDNRREPHLVLLDADTARFRATVGCNQIIGGYTQEGDALRFAAAASTMMACPPPLDAQERRLSDVLGRTAAIRLEGQGLSLLDGEGGVIASLTAVYLY
jgi:uncharacterized lipoprotein YbaY/heat shock protein HslJ